MSDDLHEHWNALHEQIVEAERIAGGEVFLVNYGRILVSREEAVRVADWRVSATGSPDAAIDVVGLDGARFVIARAEVAYVKVGTP